MTQDLMSREELNTLFGRLKDGTISADERNAIVSEAKKMFVRGKELAAELAETRVKAAIYEMQRAQQDATIAKQDLEIAKGRVFADTLPPDEAIEFHKDLDERFKRLYATPPIDLHQGYPWEVSHARH